MTLYRDLDTLPFDQPEADASPAVSTATPRRHRHVWWWTEVMEDDSRVLVSVEECRLCRKLKDPVTSRRGRTSLRAGKDAERHIAKRYGGQRVGQYGGISDVTTDLFSIQSKAGGWFSQRVWDELVKLPRTGGRIPTLIVSDRPPSGVHARRYVVRMLDDDLDLHGKP